MSSNSKSLPLDDYNGWANFWRYDIGVNVIPADTRNKATYEKWSEWQDKPIPVELHNQWKLEGKFLNGIAIILGKVWHNKEKLGLYLNGIDVDNLKAIEEICTYSCKSISIEELAKWTLVEQHLDNPNRAHIYVYSHRPFVKKSSDKVDSNLTKEINDNYLPSIEVKGQSSHGIFYCCPSLHENGKPYQIIGTREPVIANDFEQHINIIFRKYGISYLDNGKRNDKLSQIPINDLFKSDTKIYEGHNRHEALLRIMDSLLVRNRSILSSDAIRDLAMEWNGEHCLPPLDELEFNKQWKWAQKFVAKNAKQSDNNDNNVDIDNSNQEEEKQNEDKDDDDDQEEENILELVEENCSEFFLDQYGLPYAAITVNEHIETMSLNSKRFRNWLCKLFYDMTGNLLRAENLSAILNILKARSEFGGNIKQLHLRIGNTQLDPNTNYYYDLTNGSWEVVKITGIEWKIEESPPIIFRRYSNQQAQVYPVRDYPHDVFDQFMNLVNVKDEDNKLLLKCYIIALFIPEIPKPILMLHGEQGSAKSTLQELIKKLADPSIISTLSFPRDINELIQKLSHNYVAYFDNISIIKEWISDELCRAVTGSGFSKRQLYTDDDDIIYNFKRCIGFNGINLGATKADLLDRGLIIQLERIPKESRRKVEDIWSDFEKIKAQLLGYIFDILVKVLRVRNNGSIELKGHPRMADFAEVAEIISHTMGYRDNKFLTVYYKNIGLQTAQALEASPVAACIIKLMDSRTEWEGTATELLNDLGTVAESLKIKTKTNGLWPGAPNSLSRRLNEVKTNLREIGIIIDRPVDIITNTRKIEIRKISPEHPVSPEDPNQAQLQLENPGDNNSISPDISPEENTENHAQNCSSGVPVTPGILYILLLLISIV